MESELYYFALSFRHVFHVSIQLFPTDMAWIISGMMAMSMVEKFSGLCLLEFIRPFALNFTVSLLFCIEFLHLMQITRN